MFTGPLLLLLLLRSTKTLMRACVTHSTLKLCVAVITVLLHTVMLMSSIFLGTKLRDSLRIELNGLKMNQLFGISRLILRSILIIDFINVSWWWLMLVINIALATQSWEEDTRNKSCLFFLYAITHQKGKNEFLIYFIFMLNDYRERHPMMVETPHRVMCGWIKNTNKQHANMYQNNDQSPNVSVKWWSRHILANFEDLINLHANVCLNTQLTYCSLMNQEY